ncbi:TetR/AcrR family transcriptional regulator [Agreia pratensis]|nr:TetR/AcrR family transcriptional regulator [Agreia pratensis]MBF4635762.1 TetR/AcrR family transcriptional regulator [Agreia pratensis]
MANPKRVLSTAEDRRVDVLTAATAAFALRGYFGTNTTEVAHASGISQAYLYRLYDSKEALFIAVLNHVKLRIRDDLRSTFDSVPTDQIDAALAKQRAVDHDIAMVLLHAVAACVVPAVAEAVRDCYQDQLEFLRGRGASVEAVRRYLSEAQYSNALQAAGIDSSSASSELLLP